VGAGYQWAMHERKKRKAALLPFKIMDRDANVLWKMQLFEQKILFESDLKLVGKRPSHS